MVEIHPQTRQRYTRAKNNTDIILPLQGADALASEEIPVVGGWKDFTGSGGVPTKQQTYGDIPDQLWGTDAWLDGARNPQRGVLGEPTQVIRLRQRLQYIQFD